MKLLKNPPNDFHDHQLGANELTMLFPFLVCCFLITYANQKHISVFPNRSKIDPRPCKTLSWPLRDNATNLFMQKQSSEASLMNLISELKKKERLLNFAERSGAAPLFWKKQIVFTSLFKDDALSRRFLPLGIRLFFEYDSFPYEVFGPVEQLTIETDGDDFVATTEGTLALRVYGTLYDSNWINRATLPQKIHFLFTQEKNRNKTSVIILSGAKELGGVRDNAYRVSEMTLHPSSTSLMFSTGRAFYSERAPVILLKNETLRFLYAIRAFAKVFPLQTKARASSNVFDFKNKGAPLYLEVAGKRERVMRIVATGVFYSGATLASTSETIKDIAIKLENGVVIHKVCDETNKDWDPVKPGDRINLVAYNTLPSAGKASVVEDFVEDFESERFLSPSTLVWEKYRKFHDSQQNVYFDTPSSAVAQQETKNETVSPTQVVLVAIVLIAAAVFWIKPNRLLAWNVARVSVLFGILLAVLGIIYVFSRYWTIQIDTEQLGDLILYTCTALLHVSLLSVLLSSRLTFSVPTGILMMFAFCITICTYGLPEEPVLKDMTVIIMLQASMSLTYEVLKMGAKARISTMSTTMHVTHPFFVPELIGILTLLYFASAFFNNHDCPYLNEEIKILEWSISQSADQRQVDILKADLAQLKTKLAERCKKNSEKKYWAGLAILAFLLLQFFAYPFLSGVTRSAPHAHPHFINGLRVYENRVTFILSAILTVCAFLFSRPSFKESAMCRVTNSYAKTVIDKFVGHRDQIVSDVHKLGCQERENIAAFAVGFLMVCFFSVSLTSPNAS